MRVSDGLLAAHLPRLAPRLYERPAFVQPPPHQIDADAVVKRRLLDGDAAAGNPQSGRAGHQENPRQLTRLVLLDLVPHAAAAHPHGGAGLVLAEDVGELVRHVAVATGGAVVLVEED